MIFRRLRRHPEALKNERQIPAEKNAGRAERAGRAAISMNQHHPWA